MTPIRELDDVADLAARLAEPAAHQKPQGVDDAPELDHHHSRPGHRPMEGLRARAHDISISPA